MVDPDTKFRKTFEVSWRVTQVRRRSAAERSEAYSKCIAFAYSISYTLGTIGL